MNIQIQKKIDSYKRTRWACRGVVFLSTLTSIWANWLHAEQTLWPIVINCLPPVIILGGFELSSRIPLREGPWYSPVRWARPLSMLAITCIGAWLSYFHQKAAFFTYSKDATTAMLLPFAIDGLMVMASVAVLDLNLFITRLLAHQEGDKVTTYKPRDPDLAIITKVKDVEPSKKQLIADVYARFPELKPAAIAARVDATPSYVYGVMKALKAEAEAKVALNDDVAAITV
jgi:hypothetical protein